MAVLSSFIPYWLMAIPLKYSIEENPRFLTKAAFKEPLGLLPAGASFKQIEHFRQILISKQFQKFDYGKAMNTEKYS